MIDGEAMDKDRKEMTPDEKKKKLFLDQVRLLDTFLGNGAITKAQYNKSLGDLIEKMDMRDEYEEFLHQKV